MLDSIVVMSDLKPIHIVYDRTWDTIINMSHSYAESRTGVQPIIVHPFALRLIPDPTFGIGNYLIRLIVSTEP